MIVLTPGDAKRSQFNLRENDICSERERFRNKNCELRSGCYTNIPNKVTAELLGFVLRLPHSSSTYILVICIFASQFTIGRL